MLLFLNIYLLYMVFIVQLLLVSFLLVRFLKFFSYFISEKTLLIREELSPFECGFEHNNLSRVPFSLRYFYLTLIFLLFDLEVVLMLFMPYLLFSRIFRYCFLVILLFILILYFGLLYEWNDGTLEWLS